MTDKVVYVEWDDSSYGAAGWQDSTGWTGQHKPILCSSIGRLIHEDSNSLVLAPHWHDHADGVRVQGCLRIPTSAIRRRVSILTKAKRKK